MVRYIYIYIYTYIYIYIYTYICINFIHINYSVYRPRKMVDDQEMRELISAFFEGDGILFINLIIKTCSKMWLVYFWKQIGITGSKCSALWHLLSMEATEHGKPGEKLRFFSKNP